MANKMTVEQRAHTVVLYSCGIVLLRLDLSTAPTINLHPHRRP